jgi:DNA-binding XRE family transcriptional regulator
MTGQNKYKTARVMAGISQEKAAELIPVSVSTIKRIERGTQRCSADIAGAMADLYQAPWVADPTVPDDYTPKPQIQAAMCFENETEDVVGKLPRLRRILADGRVDHDEEKEFAEIKREIGEAMRAAQDFLYAG